MYRKSLYFILTFKHNSQLHTLVSYSFAYWALKNKRMEFGAHYYKFHNINIDTIIYTKYVYTNTTPYMDFKTEKLQVDMNKQQHTNKISQKQ